MRKLVTEDLFAFTKILKKANVQSEFEKLFEEGYTMKGKKNVDVEKFGIHVFTTLLSACGEDGVDNAVYKFLAHPFEMTVDDVKALPIDDLFLKVKELVKTNNMEAFFGTVGKLM